MPKARMLSSMVFGLLLLPPVAAPAADAPPAAPATRPADAPLDQAALDKKFADLLTNARLTGSYTASDAGGIKTGDAYTILRASRVDGDIWSITAQISYKGVGIPVELKLPVKWAGDTPVISLTDHKIAGMGTFTVRILFYGNQYAGTWSSPRHGGLMWGKIEKAEAPQPADPVVRPKP